MKNDPVYSTRQAAEILHISKSTLYELTKRGEINSYKVGRNIRFSQEDLEAYLHRSRNQQEGFVKKTFADSRLMFKPITNPKEVVICGQDVILDVLSNYMRLNGIPSLRSYVGSFESLLSLYSGNAQIASAHLWAGDNDEYNIPYVRRLLPGIPTVIIHLTCRMQGFYVAKGNPKHITDWTDLTRDDVTIINREIGAGSRVLLDEHLHQLGIMSDQISGYDNETSSHLTVASAVGRGEVDAGIGNEKISYQVTGIEFIPLQKESYDLVVKKEHFHSEAIQTMLRIIRSREFQHEFAHIGGYDTSGMGEIIAEI
ncbi:MAG: substrate-binding domain-containing protein [Blautia sp.]